MTGSRADRSDGRDDLDPGESAVAVARASSRRRNAARWLAAPVAAGTIIGGVLLGQAADASPRLPDRTAEQLLVDLQSARPPALSGTVTDSIDLGLPELPATAEFSGEHTWRVWTDGDDRSRVALIDGSQETSLVRDGDDLWLWSSADQTATHHVLTPGATAPSSDLPVPAEAVATTPEEAARAVLDRLDPTTEVTTAGTGSVAGRAAYELVLTPRDPATRIARVVVSIDAEHHVPLRVQVGSTTTGTNAVDIGFTSITFATPDDDVFAFTPPPGATIVEPGTDHPAADGQRSGEAPPADAQHTGDEAGVVGVGWSAVVTGYVPQEAGAGTAGESGPATTTEGQAAGEAADAAASDRQLLQAFPTASGTWGTGRVFDGPLFSAVITDDGRYAVGAVAPAALYAALPPAR